MHLGHFLRRFSPSQRMQRIQVLDAWLDPELFAGSRPKVARYATREPLAAIVDADEFLLALIALIHAGL